ncbi:HYPOTHETICAL PROTEIN MCJ_002890 [Mesomycoplasma conjunctivae]|uniref:DUF1410 domain n=1 Tax=Mesomycoplasma conjunctivae (strain ATCC 25834 / NCTC 10147 / HRC/581) TaxID=572263 RepID=C5J688_MESCH|nr:hypothetical protein [Mesomycoplasma conjunctivae]CAT04980.1 HYPOTHETICAL PROTEIN MCJ_002890 [Mesomycoplasma conjunctivae]
MKKISKTKKRALALVFVGLMGLSFGTLLIIPYLLRNWSALQYRVIDLSSQISDDKLKVDFSFSDQDSYKLDYQPLDVYIYSDSKQSKQIGKAIATYDDFRHGYTFVSDMQQLSAGNRYYFAIKQQSEYASRFGAKKYFGFGEHVSNFVNIPAAVNNINFSKINEHSALVRINFADEIKSLEGKTVALEYYYLPKDVDAKTVDKAQQRGIITSYVDAAKVENGHADFQLNNLASDVAYYVAGVKLVEADNASVELAPKIMQDVKMEHDYAFATQAIDLTIGSISSTDEINFGKKIVVNFNPLPLLSKLNGRLVELKYKNLLTNEIHSVVTHLENNVATYNLTINGKNKIDLGSSYQIISANVSGANINFAPNALKEFHTQNGIVDLESKIGATEAQINVTIASVDHVLGSEVNLAINPVSAKALKANLVHLKDNLYQASFDVSGLVNDKDYTIDRLYLSQLPQNSIFANNIGNDYRQIAWSLPLDNPRVEKRNFHSGISDLSAFLKTIPAVSANKVVINAGFDETSAYLNNKALRFVYRQEGSPTKLYSEAAIALGNSISVDIEQFNFGQKYIIEGLELVDQPDILVKLLYDPTPSGPFKLKENEFYTKARVDEISFSDIKETSAKVKLHILSASEQWANQVDKVALAYGSAPGVVSFSKTIDFNGNSLQKDASGFSLEFELDKLDRRTDYYIGDLIFGKLNPLFSGDNIVALNKHFRTTFANAKVLTSDFFAVSQNSATVEIRFNPDTDAYLDGQKFALKIKKNDGQELELGEATVEHSSLRVKLDSLDPGSKYQVVGLVYKGASENSTTSQEDQAEFAKIKFNLDDIQNKSDVFYTEPSVESISQEENKEESVKINIGLSLKNPNYQTKANNIKLVFRNKETGLVQEANGTFDQTKNQVSFDIKGLEKLSHYHIEALTIDQQNIPFNANIQDSSKDFSTVATTATVIKVEQTSKTTSSIGATIAFDPTKDAYLIGDKIKVTLSPENNPSAESLTAEATVDDELTADFVFDSKAIAGQKYKITKIEALTTTDEKKQKGLVIPPKDVGFNYSPKITDADNTKEFFTKGEVEKIEYSNVAQNSITVKATFKDDEDYFTRDGQNGTKTATLTYKNTRNNGIFTSTAVVTNKSATFSLSNLDKYTDFEIQSIDIYNNQDPAVQFSEVANNQKQFNTTVEDIQVADITYSNVTKNSVDVKISFDTFKDFYLDGKSVTINVQKENNAGQSNSVIENTTNIKKVDGKFEAKFNLQRLDEGTNFKISGISLVNLSAKTLKATHQNQANLMPDFEVVNHYPTTPGYTSPETNFQDISNNQESIKFSTDGVVQSITTEGLMQNSTSIKVRFQNENTTNEDIKFNGKMATIVYTNQDTGQIYQATATISNNEATFNLTNLVKLQKYVFESITINRKVGIHRLDLQKNFDENQKNFVTPINTVEVINIAKQATGQDGAKVTISFNNSFDGILNNKFKAKLKYKKAPGGTPNGVEQTSGEVEIKNFKAIFDLASLEQSQTYQITGVELVDKGDANGLQLSKSKNTAGGIQANPIAVNFESTINTNANKQKDFYTPSLISAINKGTQSDNASNNMVITVADPQGAYKNITTATLILENKRTGQLLNINKTAENLGSDNRTFTFSATDLEKFDEYQISDLLIDGKSVGFQRKLTENDKKFRTTANSVSVSSFQQIDKERNQAIIRFNFDVQKDWFLPKNKVRLTFENNEVNTVGKSKNKRAVSQNYEAVIAEDGSLEFTIDKEENSTALDLGNKFDVSRLDFIEEQNGLGKITYPKQTLNPNISLNNINGNKTFKTKGFITQITKENLASQTAQFQLKIENADLIGRAVTLYYTDLETGIQQQQQSIAMPAADSGQTAFTISALKDLNRYFLDHIVINNGAAATGDNLLEFDQSVQNIDRVFYTTPNVIDVDSIETKYDATSKTAVARVKFADQASQFLVGKKVKISYQAKLNGQDYGTILTSEVDGANAESVIKNDASASFKLSGNAAPVNITNFNISGTNNYDAETNTYSQDPSGTRALNLTNAGSSLIDGISYEIKNVELLDRNRNNMVELNNTAITTRFAAIKNQGDKTFSTLPISAIAYEVKTQERLDKVSAKIFVYYLSNENLENKQDKFEIALSNLTTKSFTSAKASAVEQVGAVQVGQGATNFWKVSYDVDSLEKASLYNIDYSAYNNDNIGISRYVDGTLTNPAPTDALKTHFSTPGRQTKIVDVSYNNVTDDNNASVTVRFDDPDAFLTRNALQVKLKYSTVDGLALTRVDLESKPVTVVNNIATFNLKQLAPASTYKIDAVEVIGVPDIVAGHSTNLKIKLVEENQSQAADLSSLQPDSIRDKIQEDNQYYFHTKAQLVRAEFTSTMGAQNTDTSGTLTVTFSDKGSHPKATSGFVEFIKIDPLGKKQNPVVATSLATYNTTQKTISFSLSNLEKLTTYRVLRASIGGVDYSRSFSNSDQLFFSTTAASAQVLNIEHIGLKTTQENNKPNSVSGKIKFDFGIIDNFLVQKDLKITLMDDTPDATGGQPAAAPISIIARVNNDNKGPSVEFNLADAAPALKAGHQYTINNVEIVGQSGTTVQFATNAYNNTSGQELMPLKSFWTPGNVKTIALKNAARPRELTFLLQITGDTAELNNKTVGIELEQTGDRVYYGTATTVGTTGGSTTNNQLTVEIPANGLIPLSGYTVKKIFVDGKEFPIDFNAVKQHFTSAEHFTIQKVEFDEKSNTENSTKVKLFFNPVDDHYLQGRQVKLKYKNTRGQDKNEHLLDTVAVVQEKGSGQDRQLFAEFDIPVVKSYTGANTTTTHLLNSNIYQVTGAEIDGWSPIHNVNQPPTYEFSSILTPTSADTLKQFSTKLLAPTIKSVSIGDTTNVGGGERDYRATIKVVFDDPLALVNEADLNSIKYHLYKLDDSELEATRNSRVRFENPRLQFGTNNVAERTLSVDIVGDARQWNVKNNRNGENQLKFGIEFPYYTNFAKSSTDRSNIEKMNANNQELMLSAKKYTQVTKVSGFIYGANDYAIELTVYDPFDQISVTKQDYNQAKNLFADRYRAGISSSGPYRNNQERIANIGQAINQRGVLTTSTSGNYSTERQTKYNVKFKWKKSLLNLKGIGLKSNIPAQNYEPVFSEQTLRGDRNTLAKQIANIRPSAFVTNGEFIGNGSEYRFDFKYRDGVQFQDLAPESDLFIRLMDVSKVDISNGQLVNNGDSTLYKKIWFNLTGADSEGKNLAAKIIQLDFANWKINDIPMLFAQDAPDVWNTFQTMYQFGSVWSKWVNTPGVLDRINQGAAFAPNTPVRNSHRVNTFIGRAATYPPVDTDQEWRTRAGAPNLIREPQFGIQNSVYNSETGDFKVYFYYDSDKRLRSITPTVGYAIFINEAGDTYFIPKASGDGINLDSDFNYTDKSVTFNLKSAAIPIDQRPKLGERLYFAGIGITPYFDTKLDDPSNGVWSFNKSTYEAEIKPGAVIDFATVSLNYLWQIPFLKRSTAVNIIKYT